MQEQHKLPGRQSSVHNNDGYTELGDVSRPNVGCGGTATEIIPSSQLPFYQLCMQESYIPVSDQRSEPGLMGNGHFLAWKTFLSSGLSTNVFNIPASSPLSKTQHQTKVRKPQPHLVKQNTCFNPREKNLFSLTCFLKIVN